MGCQILKSSTSCHWCRILLCFPFKSYFHWILSKDRELGGNSQIPRQKLTKNLQHSALTHITSHFIHSPVYPCNSSEKGPLLPKDFKRMLLQNTGYNHPNHHVSWKSMQGKKNAFLHLTVGEGCIHYSSVLDMCVWGRDFSILHTLTLVFCLWIGSSIFSLCLLFILDNLALPRGTESGVKDALPDSLPSTWKYVFFMTLKLSCPTEVLFGWGRPRTITSAKAGSDQSFSATFGFPREVRG